MTLIDLRVFTGFLTLEIVVGSWFAKSDNAISGGWTIAGLLIINLVLAIIALLILLCNHFRRDETKETIINCCEALGYRTDGIYLDKKKLNATTKPRTWIVFYCVGIIATFIGIVFIICNDLFSALCICNN